MNALLIRRLVVKDWYLNRLLLLLIGAAGAIAVSLLYVKNEAAGFIGVTSGFITVIILSILLPMLMIVNERKHSNLAFVMSLPISPADYTAAKIGANLLAFVVLWLAIAVGVVGTIAGAGRLGGLVPYGIVVFLAPFVVFAVLIAVALVTESELATTVTMGASNVSYSFTWYFLVRAPGVREGMRSPVPVWSDLVLTLIAAEVALIVMAIVCAFVLQSRKTDFI